MAELPRRYKEYGRFKGGRYELSHLKAAFEAGAARYPLPEEKQVDRVHGEAYHRGWRCAEHEHRARLVAEQASARLSELARRNAERRASDPARIASREAGKKAWRAGTSKRALKLIFADSNLTIAEVERGWLEARDAYLRSRLAAAGREGA